VSCTAAEADAAARTQLLPYADANRQPDPHRLLVQGLERRIGGAGCDLS
jgi:hypothetical protein